LTNETLLCGEEAQYMIRFKKKEIEQILEDRKPEINLTTYQHIKKTVDGGTDGMDPYTLSNICRDLNCLPTDIVEYV
jgi:DNA-binding Xre family transcriptional regulator